MAEISLKEVFLSCPFCDDKDVMMCGEEDKHWIMCCNCSACGPMADSEEYASHYWISRANIAEQFSGIGAKRTVSIN